MGAFHLKSILKSVLLASFLLSGTSTLAAYSLIRHSQISMLTSPSEYVLPIDIYWLNGSSWTKEQLLENLEGARQVYAECGIEFSDINIYEINSSRSVFNKYIETNKKPETRNGQPHLIEMVLALPLKVNENRLSIFLLDGYHDDNKGTPFSHARFSPPDDGRVGPLPNNTVWLTSKVNESSYKEANSTYSTLAHEMAHVLLLDGQHNNNPYFGLEADIMTLQRSRNNRVKHLCDQMVRNPLLAPVRPQLWNAEAFVQDFVIFN